MFNQCDDPIEVLAWLSQRNQHISNDDLEYMLGSEPSSDYANLESDDNIEDYDFPLFDA